MKKTQLALRVLAIAILGSVWLVGLTSSAGVYNPWYDLDDDGDIDICDVVRMAGGYGTTGDPFEAKAALEYDSGWIDIRSECGQYFDVVHSLNSTDVMVDMSGKTAVDEGVHQRHLGGTGLISGWAQTFGGGNPEYGRSAIPTVDGGFAVAGTTRSFGGGDYDFWLVKTDALGNHVWNHTYGGSGVDGVYELIQASDGGYVIIGDTDSFGAGGRDFWLVKTDALGNHVWNHTYGGPNHDTGTSVVQTSDGGYLMVGNTYSFGAGGYDLWLVKTDGVGNQQWDHTFGGIAHDKGTSVIQTLDGGYAAAGNTQSFGMGLEDMWLVKTDKQGNHMWNQTYGGSDSDWCYQVVESADGFVMAGATSSFALGPSDAWLVTTDRFGNLLWSHIYGGAGEECGYSVTQTRDGGYAIAGYTTSRGAGQGDLWLVKTDAWGNHLWNQTQGGHFDEYGRAVMQTSDGGYVVAGETISFGAGSFDFYLVRMSMESGIAWTDSTTNAITLYRGATDSYWNFVRVRIWEIKETP